MSTLKQLIQSQDIAFDTHQAGDSQTTNWKAVHLEKSMHGKRGKARFPLLGETKASKSKSMSDEDFKYIKSEVQKALKKSPRLVEELAKVVAQELNRFSEKQATETDARKAAKKLAEYFGLKETFEEIVIREFKGHIASITTFHLVLGTSDFYEIEQSAKAIRIRKERRYVRRNVMS